jgi:hypothetical protein
MLLILRIFGAFVGKRGFTPGIAWLNICRTMAPDANAGLQAIFGKISKAELGRKLGITPAAVGQWRRVPVLHVLTVESLTGVSRYEQRPDVYGQRPPARQAAA